MLWDLRFTPTVEALDDRLTPSTQPADIVVSVDPEGASQVRHRSFAIVDRTQLRTPSDVQPAADHLRVVLDATAMALDSRAGVGVLKSTDSGRIWGAVNTPEH